MKKKMATVLAVMILAAFLSACGKEKESQVQPTYTSEELQVYRAELSNGVAYVVDGEGKALTNYQMDENGNITAAGNIVIKADDVKEFKPVTAIISLSDTQSIEATLMRQIKAGTVDEYENMPALYEYKLYVSPSDASRPQLRVSSSDSSVAEIEPGAKDKPENGSVLCTPEEGIVSVYVRCKNEGRATVKTVTTDESNLSYAGEMSGTDAVAFVTLERIPALPYIEKITAAVHEDPEDEDQTVHIGIPAVHTFAETDDGRKVVKYLPAEIVDTVVYENLDPGTEYRLEGVLMNKETEEPVTDREGNPITATVTFVPEEQNGETEMAYILDNPDYDGSDIVVFESLYQEDELIADHCDIDDEAQAVFVDLEYFLKTDPEGELLEGAVIEMTDKTANTTVEVTSDIDGRIYYELAPNHKYMYRETKAPEGYIQSGGSYRHRKEKSPMKEFIRNEEGQSMVEYALILALISVVAITALKAIGTNVNAKLESIGNELSA